MIRCINKLIGGLVEKDEDCEDLHRKGEIEKIRDEEEYNEETMKGSARDMSDGAGLEWKGLKKGPEGAIRN